MTNPDIQRIIKHYEDQGFEPYAATPGFLGKSLSGYSDLFIVFDDSDSHITVVKLIAIAATPELKKAVENLAEPGTAWELVTPETFVNETEAM